MNTFFFEYFAFVIEHDVKFYCISWNGEKGNEQRKNNIMKMVASPKRQRAVESKWMEITIESLKLWKQAKHE